MLTVILGFISGLFAPLASIAGKIADAKIAAAKAATDQERIHAEERVATLTARKEVMLAESGSRVNAWVRAGFALPFVIYNGKLVLWDKVFALGSTDALSPELFQIEMACIAFYFLYDITARLKRK